MKVWFLIWCLSQEEYIKIIITISIVRQNFLLKWRSFLMLFQHFGIWNPNPAFANEKRRESFAHLSKKSFSNKERDCLILSVRDKKLA